MANLTNLSTNTISWTLAANRQNVIRRTIKSDEYYFRRNGKHTAWSLELKSHGTNRSKLVLNSHDLHFEGTPIVWCRCTITDDTGNEMVWQQPGYTVVQHKRIFFDDMYVTLDEHRGVKIDISVVFNDAALVYCSKAIEEEMVLEEMVRMMDVPMRRRSFKLWRNAAHMEFDVRSG